MKELIRRVRLAYSVYNFFHKKELLYNEVNYKKLGLQKRYYSSVSSKDFAKLPTLSPDYGESNQQKLKATKLYSQLSIDDKNSLLNFHQNGHAIIRNYLPSQQVDVINDQMDLLVAQNKLKSNKSKLFGALHHSHPIKNVGTNHKLKEVLSVLLGGNPLLFGSMNFIMGSEMGSHSDSIHMTTYPLGGIIAVWIALEDMTEDNGPLHYYPGSHKFPYYLNSDYDNEGNFFLIGNKSYEAYETMLNKKIKEHNIPKSVFLAKKGDLMIWHANLIHGGEPHLDKSKTRKSMVFHYYREDSICYHEITQRPAIRGKSY